MRAIAEEAEEGDRVPNLLKEGLHQRVGERVKTVACETSANCRKDGRPRGDQGRFRVGGPGSSGLSSGPVTGTEAEATCWTVVRGAVAGRTEDRETFARWYLPVVSAYLLARWNGTPLVAELDDAVQEVFYDCFRENGALARADSTRPGGFRAFLFGVVRNIALRREAAKRRSREVQPDSGFVERLRAREDSVNSAFDRAWAMAVLREAQDRFRDRAAAGGEAARRRYDLLRLRFEDGLPVRKIAARLDVSADRAHKDYAKARQEFRKELLAVVAMHRPGGRTEVQREAANLIALVRPS